MEVLEYHGNTTMMGYSWSHNGDIVESSQVVAGYMWLYGGYGRDSY